MGVYINSGRSHMDVSADDLLVANPEVDKLVGGELGELLVVLEEGNDLRLASLGEEALEVLLQLGLDEGLGLLTTTGVADG